jgi:uncharacterized protein YbjQ (UPF0145 family)
MDIIDDHHGETPVNKMRYLLVFVMGAWLIGCTPWQSTLTNEERSFPPTAAEKVQIFLQGESVPASKEIGHLVVIETSEKEGIAFLQKKASELGADGVINVEVRIETRVYFLIVFPIPMNSYVVSGTAIRTTTL